MRGRTEAVRLLLKQGAQVNQASSHGWTPLMAAAWENHGEIVTLLLKAGADPTQSNTDGKTARMLAESAGNTRVVERLQR